MSGSLLKILACSAMLLDHIAAFCPELVSGIGDSLFSVGNKEITLGYIMNSIGRIAFPIFAFLITEGFVYTGNRKRYALNLLIFAFASEIPFNLAYSGTIFSIKQNVFFTLLLGYLGICALDQYTNKRNSASLIVILALFVTSITLRADYGCFGFGFIILLYILRSNKLLMAVIGACVLPSRWIGGMAFIPICLYNGKRGFATGTISKYAFYLFYPLHLALLYLVRHFLL